MAAEKPGSDAPPTPPLPPTAPPPPPAPFWGGVSAPPPPPPGSPQRGGGDAAAGGGGGVAWGWGRGWGGGHAAAGADGRSGRGLRPGGRGHPACGHAAPPPSARPAPALRGRGPAPLRPSPLRAAAPALRGRGVGVRAGVSGGTHVRSPSPRPRAGPFAGGGGAWGGSPGPPPGAGGPRGSPGVPPPRLSPDRRPDHALLLLAHRRGGHRQGRAGARGRGPRGHRVSRDRLQGGSELLLHQPGRGHRRHRALHHPHRGHHHRCPAPGQRLGPLRDPQKQKKTRKNKKKPQKNGPGMRCGGVRAAPSQNNPGGGGGGVVVVSMATRGGVRGDTPIVLLWQRGVGSGGHPIIRGGDDFYCANASALPWQRV